MSPLFCDAWLLPEPNLEGIRAGLEEDLRNEQYGIIRVLLFLVCMAKYRSYHFN